MSYLDKLLAGRPVTWKPLGEVAEIKHGTGYKHLHRGKIPVYGSGGIMTYVDQYVYDKPTVLIPRKGSLGNLFYLEEPFWNVDTIYYTKIDSSIIIPKLLYYYLQTQHLEKKNNAGGVPSLTQELLKPILIPIPPRDVQEEIVRVLDRFTELEAELETELEAELEARQKQYAYYRDLLLSFPDDAVTYLPLGDVVDIRRGKRVVRKDLAEEGSYAVFQNSLTPLGYFDKWNVPKDSCFVVAAGAAGEIGYSRENFWAADDIYYFESSGNLIDRYLYHFLLSSKHMITSKVRKASIPRLSRIALERLPIPIPPLEEQERIVGILDRFETLAHSITEGLPRELELRRMQYSYYRDLLLTFTPQD